MSSVKLRQSRIPLTQSSRRRQFRAHYSSQPAPVELGNLSSVHPDAVRRRKEAEERRRKRDKERSTEAYMASMGVQWWEGVQPANMLLVQTADEYKKALSCAQEEGRLLVAKFFTEDCYVCKSLHNKIKQIALDNPDVLWVKLNGSDPKLTAVFEALEIRKVPYFHMVLDGELVRELTCSLNPEKLSLFRAELAALRSKAHMMQHPAAAAAHHHALPQHHAQQHMSQQQQQHDGVQAHLLQVAPVVDAITGAI